jgi:hypothetical protein
MERTRERQKVVGGKLVKDNRGEIKMERKKSWKD